MLLWWADGASSVSLNEISRRTGFSKSSLYREFGGEDRLMAAALEQYRLLSVVPLLGLFKRDLPPDDTLALVVKATTPDRGLPAGCFFTNLRLIKRKPGESTRALVEQMVQQRQDAFEDWFRVIAERGLIHPSLSPTDAARYLDAQLTLVLIRLAADDPKDIISADATLALRVLLRRP